jgi:hypothetical protein
VPRSATNPGGSTQRHGARWRDATCQLDATCVFPRRRESHPPGAAVRLPTPRLGGCGWVWDMSRSPGCGSLASTASPSRIPALRLLRCGHPAAMIAPPLAVRALRPHTVHLPGFAHLAARPHIAGSPACDGPWSSLLAQRAVGRKGQGVRPIDASGTALVVTTGDQSLLCRGTTTERRVRDPPGASSDG